jgi:hypothetical protein
MRIGSHGAQSVMFATAEMLRAKVIAGGQSRPAAIKPTLPPPSVAASGDSSQCRRFARE